MDVNNTSEEILCHQDSEKVMVKRTYSSGNNVLNIEEEADSTSIHSINETNYISMNYYDNYMHEYYAPFLSSKNHEYVSSGSKYDSA